MTAMRRASLLVALMASSRAAIASDPADSARRAACRASVTADKLLAAPNDPELYDYASCSELVTGRAGLCDAFPGGPKSAAKAPLEHEVIAADGTVKRETTYGTCYSRAAAYRFLSLLVSGASDKELRPQMKLLLYGENLPVDEVLRTYTGAYRGQTLEGLARPDLARVGFFHHVLGAKACASVKPAGLKRECYKKAAALAAIRAKDAARCQEGDFLCRALLTGPGVCQEIGDRIVGRFCDGRKDLPPVKLAPVPKA